MKFRAWAETPNIKSRYTVDVEIDDEDLEGYEGYERDRFIDEFVFDDLCQRVIEWGWEASDDRG